MYRENNKISVKIFEKQGHYSNINEVFQTPIDTWNLYVFIPNTVRISFSHI